MQLELRLNVQQFHVSFSFLSIFVKLSIALVFKISLKCLEKCFIFNL